MAENSAIEWTDHTFNPVVGCTRVSDACKYCYAAEYAKRYEPLVTWGGPGQRAVLRRTAPSNWRKPLSWNKRAKNPEFGERRPRVFCASLADVFDNDWEPQVRADLWDLIEATPALDWLLLTKRPQNIKEMLPKDWGDGWPNVWLGTTVENQEEANRRIWHLLDVPARVHFLSCEPLLGAVDLRPHIGPDPTGARKISWVIIGGESGHNFRTMSMEWVATMRVQCRDANVPVFFKQDSSIKPGCKGRASDALWACKQFPQSRSAAEVR
jgi:protein gp37